MNKLHKKDFSIAFKTGSDANKSKFKKEAVQGEIYHATDTGLFYVAETTAGAIDATLAQFGGSVFTNDYSVDLDGTNDYIDCGGDADFSFTDGAGNDSAFSISAWVKLDSSRIQRIVDKSGTTQASRSYLFGTDGDSKLNIFLGPGTSNYLYIRETAVLSTGTWHHIVCTYDGSNTEGGLTLYRAGSEITPQLLSSGSYAGLPSTSETLKIGRLNLNGSVMNGLVDEVAVFDYELTALQVSDIYNGGVPNDISSLSPLGWWRMGDNDNGTGTTITDQGSGGNDGTLNNIVSPYGIVSGTGKTP